MSGRVAQGVDYASLSHAQRVDELTRLQQLKAQLEAAELRVLAAMSARPYRCFVERPRELSRELPADTYSP